MTNIQWEPDYMNIYALERPAGRKRSGTKNSKERKMAEEKTYPFRIHYRQEDGTMGTYYIREENANFAVTAFLLQTKNARESVIAVDTACGHNWKRVL